MIAKYIGLSTLRNEEKHFTKPLLLMKKRLNVQSDFICQAVQIKQQIYINKTAVGMLCKAIEDLRVYI